MLHVDDLLDLILIQIAQLDGLSGRVFNVGGGPEVSASLLEMTQLCREFTGREIAIEADPKDRPADIPWYVTDNARITAATGWKPIRGVPEIMQEICTWISENAEMLRPILA